MNLSKVGGPGLDFARGVLNIPKPLPGPEEIGQEVGRTVGRVVLGKRKTWTAPGSHVQGIRLRHSKARRTVQTDASGQLTAHQKNQWYKAHGLKRRVPEGTKPTKARYDRASQLKSRYKKPSGYPGRKSSLHVDLNRYRYEKSKKRGAKEPPPLTRHRRHKRPRVSQRTLLGGQLKAAQARYDTRIDRHKAWSTGVYYPGPFRKYWRKWDRYYWY